MQCCVVPRLVQRLISRLVAVFILFLLKDLHQSSTNSTNDLGVNVADSETWIFRWLRFYHINCRHFVDVYFNLGGVSLFVDSPFTFLLRFVYDVWMNEYRFVFVKKIFIFILYIKKITPFNFFWVDFFSIQKCHQFSI